MLIPYRSQYRREGLYGSTIHSGMSVLKVRYVGTYNRRADACVLCRCPRPAAQRLPLEHLCTLRREVTY
jgi:hypothetical protein